MRSVYLGTWSIGQALTGRYGRGRIPLISGRVRASACLGPASPPCSAHGTGAPASGVKVKRWPPEKWVGSPSRASAYGSPPWGTNTWHSSSVTVPRLDRRRTTMRGGSLRKRCRTAPAPRHSADCLQRSRFLRRGRHPPQGCAGWRIRQPPGYTGHLGRDPAPSKEAPSSSGAWPESTVIQAQYATHLRHRNRSGSCGARPGATHIVRPSRLRKGPWT